jgi:hypothetical protein
VLSPLQIGALSRGLSHVPTLHGLTTVTGAHERLSFERLMMLRCVFRSSTHGYGWQVLSGRSSSARLCIDRPACSQSQDVKAAGTLHHRLGPSVDLRGIALVGFAAAQTPLPSSARTTASALSADAAYVMPTAAPSRARRFAIAAPMPREPSVTKATFPIRFFAMISLRCASAQICTDQ